MSYEAAIVDEIRKSGINLTRELPDEYRYSCLPLCVVDAVFSIGVNYRSTRKVVSNWCGCQNPPWLLLRKRGAPEHTITEFVALLRAHYAEFLVTVFRNRQRTSSRGGILKAEAVALFSEALQEHGIDTLMDTRDGVRNSKVELDIRKIPGQGSGISFEYFLMLAGSDAYVKADRMICRFVARALGQKEVTRDQARQAIKLLLST